MEWVVLGLFVVVFTFCGEKGGLIYEREEMRHLLQFAPGPHIGPAKGRRGKLAPVKRAQGKRSGSSRVPSKSRSRGDSAAGRGQEDEVSCPDCRESRHPAKFARCIKFVKTRPAELGVAPLWCYYEKEDWIEWGRKYQWKYDCREYDEYRWEFVYNAYSGGWESGDEFYWPRCIVCEQQDCECLDWRPEIETECTICEEVFLDECRCG